MKKIIVSVLCLIAFLFAGCASNAGADRIQKLLDTALPSEFVGDAHVEHFNPCFDFTIDAKGLRKNPAGIWQWSELKVNRHDRWSAGKVELTPAK